VDTSSPKKPSAGTAPAAGPTAGKNDIEVVVLQTRCIGASVCVYEARGSFKLNAMRKAVVTDLSKNPSETILNAARNCPTQAIMIYKNKKQIWPPPGKEGQDKQPGPKLKMSLDIQ
jgi:ferredoxin